MIKASILIILIAFSMPLSAEQLILFDKEFTFEEKDAIPTKSHLYVEASEFDKATPKNWKSPINFADGKVKIIIDVLEKPEGDTPTYWSVCYIGNKGQNGSRYSVAGSLNTPKPVVMR